MTICVYLQTKHAIKPTMRLDGNLCDDISYAYNVGSRHNMIKITCNSMDHFLCRRRIQLQDHCQEAAADPQQDGRGLWDRFLRIASMKIM